MLGVYLSKNGRSSSGIICLLNGEELPVVRDQYLIYEIQGRSPTEVQMRQLVDTGGMQVSVNGVIKTAIPETPTKEDFMTMWIRQSAFHVDNFPKEDASDMPMGWSLLNGIPRSRQMDEKLGQEVPMETQSLPRSRQTDERLDQEVLMETQSLERTTEERTLVTATPMEVQQPKMWIDELIGRQIRKDFGKAGVFIGTIMSVKKPYYSIEYEDGDSEDMTLREVNRLLIPLAGSVRMATAAELDSEDEWENDKEYDVIRSESRCNFEEPKRRSNVVEKIARRVAKVIRQRTEHNPTWKTMIDDPQLRKIWMPIVNVETKEFLQCCQDTEWNRIPDGTEILQVMIDLRTKFVLETGEIDKLKARMNIMGDPKHMVRIKEEEKHLYAPTPKLETFMLMFAIAAYMGWKLSGFDVVKAFKNTPAEQRRFVTLPKELTGGVKRVFELMTVMHGLPEASRMWFEYLGRHQRGKGYIQCVADPTSWVKWEGEHCIIVTIHTDDGAVLTSSDKLELQLKTDLREFVEITEQSTLEHHLGMHLEYNDDGSITIRTPANRRKLLAAGRELVGEFEIGVRSPMSHEWDEEYQADAPQCDYDSFMHVLGLAIQETRTRLDIITSVGILSARSTVATVRDMDALMRVVAYVAGSEDIGVTFHPGTEGAQSVVQLMYWCDASCAGPQPRMGYGAKVGNDIDSRSGMVSATSFKDTHTTPMSAAESELTIDKETTKTAIWQRLLLNEWGLLKQDAPSDIFTDSMPVVDMTFDYRSNNRKTRHRMMDIDFIMQAVKRDVIRNVHIKGTRQIADGFTKPLTAIKHLQQLSGIQGESEAVERFTQAMRRQRSKRVHMIRELTLEQARRNGIENKHAHKIE